MVVFGVYIVSFLLFLSFTYFQAFEWTVPNVRNLKSFVESQPNVSTASSLHSDDSHASQGSNIPSLLRETPEVAEGKFKLEICRAVRDDASVTEVPGQANDGDTAESIAVKVNPEAAGPPVLSLCLTYLQLDYDPDCEIAATIMAGIKTTSDFVGQRGARTEWVWEIWEDFVFRKGSEFWGAVLHSLPILF